MKLESPKAKKHMSSKTKKAATFFTGLVGAGLIVGGATGLNVTEPNKISSVDLSMAYDQVYDVLDEKLIEVFPEYGNYEKRDINSVSFKNINENDVKVEVSCEAIDKIRTVYIDAVYKVNVDFYNDVVSAKNSSFDLYVAALNNCFENMQYTNEYNVHTTKNKTEEDELAK